MNFMFYFLFFIFSVGYKNISLITNVESIKISSEFSQVKHCRGLFIYSHCIFSGGAVVYFSKSTGYYSMALYHSFFH